MFFSVKSPMKILGKTYLPCICYDLTKVLGATVEKLVSEDKAVIHEKEVGFMNGKVLIKFPKVSSKKASKKEAVVEEPIVEESKIIDPSISEEIVEGGF